MEHLKQLKKKAEAQLAYELQAAKIRQKIRNEEIQIDVVERRKQIEIEEQEVQRKERELNATVRLPAEAESYHVQMIAEGKRTQTVEVAKADAEKIKKIGAAEAYAIEGVGKAEAERMRMKAAVYKHYGEAAILSLVLDALPKIAAEVAAPLAKTEEIVLLGGDDRTTAEVSRLVGQIPPAMHALTGVDVSKIVLAVDNSEDVRHDAGVKYVGLDDNLAICGELADAMNNRNDIASSDEDGEHGTSREVDPNIYTGLGPHQRAETVY
uniref:Flotillin n=1 Tax=Timema douglasi TaxID=61478 RepID=A0A7R8VBU6_TIMDO|nr:unnamed protein product [Timema douglasi]